MLRFHQLSDAVHSASATPTIGCVSCDFMGVCVSTLLQIGWFPPSYVPSSTVTEISCPLIRTDTTLVASGCGQETCVQSFFQILSTIFFEQTLTESTMSAGALDTAGSV